MMTKKIFFFACCFTLNAHAMQQSIPPNTLYLREKTLINLRYAHMQTELQHALTELWLEREARHNQAELKAREERKFLALQQWHTQQKKNLPSINFNNLPPIIKKVIEPEV